MKLEAIGGVSMGDMGFEVCWQIDNVDRSEGTLFGADTASDAKTFRNESYLRFWSDFYAQTSASHNGARFLAFLSAFL
jgi:hypothetical protein